MSRHVDVVIPAWNNLSYTQACVESFFSRNTDPDTPYHLILVDNGSEDGTREYIHGVMRANPGRVKCIENDTNEGWVVACNQGHELSCSDAGYVMFLNNDTVIVEDEMLKRLVDRISDKRYTAGVGPVSNAVSGRQSVLYDNPRIEAEFDAPFIIGFCMLLKKDVLDIVKHHDGFVMDPRFSPGGADELDLCIRIQSHGYSFAIDRKVFLHHSCSKTLAKVTSDLPAFHEGKMKILVEKHGDATVAAFMGAVKKRTLIGIPTVGHVHHKFIKTLLTLEKPEGITIETFPRTLPHVARNSLIGMAIENGFDYLLFLDDDMIFDQANLLMKFIAYLDEHPDVDVIAPFAYMRNPPYYPCVFMEDPSNPPYYTLYTEQDKGKVEVDAITCAVTLVRVDLLRRMKKPWFEFHTIGNEMVGEDVYFCHKAKKEHGAKIICDSDQQVWHIGDNLLVGRPTYEAHHSHKVVRELMKF